MDIHFFSKSPAERIGFGLSRMTGGSPGKGTLGISICTIQYMVIAKEIVVNHSLLVYQFLPAKFFGYKVL